jgi:hypothetical protein
MTTKTGIPEGWIYEPGDPSVGIFGHTWIHDACLHDLTDESEVTEIEVSALREGDYIVVTVQLTCSDCGATTEVTEWEWDGPVRRMRRFTFRWIGSVGE